LNWALEYVRAAIISSAILTEPVIAALLAWLVLSERPAGTATVLGGLVVFAGI
jgi:drug/metabolite transporter (DMT)-like permease